MRFGISGHTIMPSDPLHKAHLSVAKELEKPQKGYSISNLPDTEIWNEFKNGNEGAFNHIYVSHFQELFKYGQQFTQDTELIKDLIQDLFIRIRKNRKSLGKAESIKFYLMKAFRRDVIRYLKKRRMEYKEDIEPFSNMQVDLSFDIEFQHSQTNALRKRALEKSFAKLTTKQKEAIYYYFYQSLSYQEIADLMGFGHVRSARNLVYKAIEQMKALLGALKNELFIFFTLLPFKIFIIIPA